MVYNIENKHTQTANGLSSVDKVLLGHYFIFL